MRILSLLLCLIVGLSACHNKNDVPSGILQKPQMQAVLWDVIQAEAYTNSSVKKFFPKGPAAEDADWLKQVFAIHNISREDFYKSYNYYEEHADLMLVLLDSMTVQERRNENTRLKIKNVSAAISDSLKIKELRNKNLLLKTKLNSLDSIKQKELKNKKQLAKPKIISLTQGKRL